MRDILRKVIERFPTIALFYRSLRDQLNRRKPSLETRWGFTLAGHIAMARGDFEPQETAVVRQLLMNVDVLVNVGANVGYYCCHALSMGKQVVAIEPITSNLHYLLKNISDNGWAKQAQVLPVALGANTDILPIWGGDGCLIGQGLGRYTCELRHQGASAESRSPIGQQHAGAASVDPG